MSRSPHTQRRVLVTGIGLLSPLGIDRESTWRGLVEGRSGIGEVTRFDSSAFPSRIAGEVRGFEPKELVTRRDLPTMDLFEIYAVAAALEAVKDADFDVKSAAERTAVVFGVGLGGISSMERHHGTLRDRGPRRVSPYLVPMMIPNMAASHVSIRLGAKGPCEVVTTACASGAHAVAFARRLICDGVADVVVAGGAEAAITPLAFAGFCSMRALSRRNGDPSRSCRPFDSSRDGFVMAEGAAALVLEASDHAEQRDAKVYAELAGAASTADAHHITQPDPDGAGQARCITLALADAGLDPSEVDHINAHGTGTSQNDEAESRAILTAFGEQEGRRVPVCSTKSMTGHLLGAAGALEGAICALTISRGVIPPTINLEDPDPRCPLRHVLEPLESTIEVALSNSFGFGGTNATLIFRRPNRTEAS